MHDMAIRGFELRLEKSPVDEAFLSNIDSTFDSIVGNRTIIHIPVDAEPSEGMSTHPPHSGRKPSSDESEGRNFIANVVAMTQRSPGIQIFHHHQRDMG